MLTAHLPSGYVLARHAPPGHGVIPAALIGAVLPDIDMLWFHLIDQGQVNHHRYWTHVPLFWAAIAALVLPLVWRSAARAPALAFFAGLLLHLFLDSINGGILWGAPFSTQLFHLVTVPPTHGHWVISFLLHWTFALELAIWVWAAWLFRRSRPLSAHRPPV